MGTTTVRALQSVDLDIHLNEFVALMGPSGSGKSTLMNLLGCLDTPTDGEYLLGGEQVSKMDDNELAAIRNRRIGFVFQTFNLLPRLSALENVALPLVYAGISKEERLKKSRTVLELVGLGDRVDHKPNEMSGGQRQRVAVARALVNDPTIILADETLSALDLHVQEEILNLLREIVDNKQIAIVLITHDDRLAQTFCHKIVDMTDGGIR
ncbi:UNVERIFIED_CONTAM: hypothetical protein GTU68_028325 [Idotea baltica]|nr:hypothetical protein [Idotea baltica]